MRTVVCVTSLEEESKVFEIMKDKWSKGNAPKKTNYIGGQNSIGICLQNAFKHYSFSWCRMSYFTNNKDSNVITFQQFLDEFAPKPQLTKGQLCNKLFLKWVELNNIKVGSKVKIIGNLDLALRHGIEATNDLIGKVMKVTVVPEHKEAFSIRLEDDYYWPYECLKVVEEDEYKSLNDLMQKHKFVGYKSNHRLSLDWKGIVVSDGNAGWIIANTTTRNVYYNANETEDNFQKDFKAGCYVIFNIEKELYDWKLSK